MSNNSIEVVKQQFESWRADPNKSQKIPDILWKQVIPLLNHYKISEVLSTLRMSHRQLKDQIARFNGTAKQSVGKPSKLAKTKDTFVSCNIPVQSMGNIYQVELQRLDGTILRLREVHQQTLDNLLQSFLG